jgi:hypothetical protein
MGKKREAALQSKVASMIAAQQAEAAKREQRLMTAMRDIQGKQFTILTSGGHVVAARAAVVNVTRDASGLMEYSAQVYLYPNEG